MLRRTLEMRARRGRHARVAALGAALAMCVGCASAPDNADDVRPVPPEIAAIQAARTDAETAHLPGGAVVYNRDGVFEFAFDQTDCPDWYNAGFAEPTKRIAKLKIWDDGVVQLRTFISGDFWGHVEGERLVLHGFQVFPSPSDGELVQCAMAADLAWESTEADAAALGVYGEVMAPTPGSSTDLACRVRSIASFRPMELAFPLMDP